MSDLIAQPRSARDRVFALPRAFRLLVIAAGFLVSVLPATAEHTRFWRQSDYDAFLKGDAKGVAVRSDGKLVLAPKFAPFADASLAYLWSLKLDSRGNLYAAGGSNAKIVKFDNSGGSSTVFDSQEMTAQALIFDKSDNLYVATAPDGKVYKVTPAGQKSVFFDPKTKYIWDLALGSDGTLFVATGDPGKIFAVDPSGNSQLFYSAEETHVRTLVLDGKGNLLAGTEPNGLVLRIAIADGSATARNGKAPAPRQSSPKRAPAQAAANEKDSSDETGRSAYVVYETAKKEVTALALDPAGNLYVAAIGEKRPGTPQPPAQQGEQENAPSGQTITVTVGGAGGLQQPQPGNPFVPFPALSTAAVYRIAPDGSPEEIWSSRDTSVYAMGLSSGGKLLLGTGNQGAIMQLEGDRVFSRLAKAESQQVTAFARASNGKIYVATANPGKVFTLGPELESEGTFQSEPFDARIFSRWGRLTWWGDNSAGSGIELSVRAGNTSDPGKNWSPWAGPYRDPKGQEVDCPPARFVQWKATLHGGNNPPDLSWVEMAYLPKNLGPEISGVVMQNPGVRVSGFGQQAGPPQASPVTLRMPAAPGSQSGSSQRSSESPRFEPPPQGYAQKGYQAVLWSAEDPNDDELTYSVYYRGENEKDWKLLKDKLEQKFYSWDTNSMPDGAYYVRIVASDERTNPPNEALKAERVSDRFVIDNTPPTISEIASQPAPGPAGDPSVTVRFRAADSASSIVRAQYSLDAGDWTIAPPEGALSDSPAEQYSITLRGVMPGEHTVSVRVYDQFENEAAAKVTFNVPAASAKR
jgi:sugar lactone lactonase YvrE